MLPLRWMAIALLVVAPVAIATQHASHTTNAADPAAATTPVTFASTFAGYQAMQEEQDAAHDRWRAANAEVKELGGHGDHVKPAPLTVKAGTDAGVPTAASDAKAPSDHAHHDHHAAHVHHAAHGADDKHKEKQ